MGSRIELQSLLEELLGSRNVYFQPPASLVMKFPAIVYGLSKIRLTHADGKNYLKGRSYDITLIDSDPDSQIIDRILELTYTSFDRHFKSDNLNHYTFTIYF